MIKNLNYETKKCEIIRNREVVLYWTEAIPQDFITLVDYCKKQNSKKVEIKDEITIYLIIDKDKKIVFHKTLFDKVADVDFIYKNLRLSNFFSLDIENCYNLINRYK